MFLHPWWWVVKQEQKGKRGGNVSMRKYNSGLYVVHPFFFSLSLSSRFSSPAFYELKPLSRNKGHVIVMKFPSSKLGWNESERKDFRTFPCMRMQWPWFFDLECKFLFETIFFFFWNKVLILFYNRWKKFCEIKVDNNSVFYTLWICRL